MSDDDYPKLTESNDRVTLQMVDGNGKTVQLGLHWIAGSRMLRVEPSEPFSLGGSTHATDQPGKGRACCDDVTIATMCFDVLNQGDDDGLGGLDREPECFGKSKDDSKMCKVCPCKIACAGIEAGRQVAAPSLSKEEPEDPQALVKGEIEDLLKADSGMNAWEIRFVESIKEQLDGDFTLSNKQRDKVHKTWDKVCG